MEINTVSIVGLGAGGNLLIRHIFGHPSSEPPSDRPNYMPEYANL